MLRCSNSDYIILKKIHKKLPAFFKERTIFMLCCNYWNLNFHFSVGFDFKKLMSKSKPSSPTVSYHEGGKIKLGVPDSSSELQGQLGLQSVINLYQAHTCACILLTVFII